MEVISVFIEKHRGRVIGGAGDSLLAELASVVDEYGVLRRPSMLRFGWLSNENINLFYYN